MFQPCTLTTSNLVSIVYFYIAYLLNPSIRLLLLSNVLLGRVSNSCPASSAIDIRTVAAQDYPSTWSSPFSIPEYPKTYRVLVDF